mgnify:CR=1 FL=1
MTTPNLELLRYGVRSQDGQLLGYVADLLQAAQLCGPYDRVERLSTDHSFVVWDGPTCGCPANDYDGFEETVRLREAEQREAVEAPVLIGLLPADVLKERTREVHEVLAEADRLRKKGHESQGFRILRNYLSSRSFPSL